MNKRIRNGFYLTLDGPDGCGKTTQFNLLRDRLASDGYDLLTGVREPGGTVLGEKIREILLHDRSVDFGREVQMMLYQTARRDIFDKLIVPALSEGKLVLADRSFDSTTVYQGYAGGISLGVIDYFNNFASCGRSPDLSFILDVQSAQKALERVGPTKDKIESESVDFHEKVVGGYRAVANLNSQRCVLVPYIDGRPGEIHEFIYGEAKKRLEKCRLF